MSVPVLFAETQLQFIWQRATPEAKVIIFILALGSIYIWALMVAKTLQLRRAKKLNDFFYKEFTTQKNVLGVFDRRLQVDGCPMFAVYHAGCIELDARLKIKGEGGTEGRDKYVTIKSMEHIKRAVEGAVASQSMKLEERLVWLAIAVSGAPFAGLLGTVWGVMDTFAAVGRMGRADLPTMAPGVSAALATTVAGLLVAIPSMFAYNWLVHSLRFRTVELDNYAQELISKMETEYLRE